MKKTIYIAFLIGYTALQMSFKSKEPSVIFDKISVKLSEIKNIENGRIKYRFQFLNNTKKPIHILDLHTSCTCTIGLASKGDIQPNKKGFVELTANVESLKQNLRVEAVIKFNTPDAPFHKVSIVYDKK